MSVDKFGRDFGLGNEARKGPPGTGFKLTPDGNYDIQFKTLTNVADPVNTQDAANLNTLKVLGKTCLRRFNDDDDDKFNGEGRIIRNVADPAYPSDVVNLKTLGENCVVFDATTINALGRNVINVADPVKDQDATNKRYVDRSIPSKTKSYWGFGKRRLANIGEPLDASDAVTKKFCYDLESRLRKEISTATSSNNQRIVAQEESISNLRGAVNALSDLIDKHYRKNQQQIRKFGQLLYPHVVHGQRGRSATENADNYINWDDVFYPTV